jgi:hypothetical protein
METEKSINKQMRDYGQKRAKDYLMFLVTGLPKKEYIPQSIEDLITSTFYAGFSSGSRWMMEKIINEKNSNG